MADFNPIRDLRSPEADPFNVPAGQSTQEVEDMRLRLVLTREKTENIVKIIKNKGRVFKKDVEKIQELQRRLRKTIPRIPILRGDASVQGGSEEEITRRSFGFDLDFNRRFKTKTKVPTPDKFPLFDLEPYEQTKINNKFTVIVPVEEMLTFQSKLFIPKSKWKQYD